MADGSDHPERMTCVAAFTDMRLCNDAIWRIGVLQRIQGSLAAVNTLGSIFRSQ